MLCLKENSIMDFLKLKSTIQNHEATFSLIDKIYLWEVIIEPIHIDDENFDRGKY